MVFDATRQLNSVYITSIFLLSVMGDVITKKVLLSQHPKSKQHYSLLDEHFLPDIGAFFNEFKAFSMS